ncbi:hypothetical protein CPB84DRAFT_1792915 [Gymnopilus junonius]|uniref:Uncharacterized protein n=1 Tax=Gymnopilus junonius TaxID=109634 RepID=A0A9P5THZ7_GYMJU|nr:hypothetical protein CPB84DRAFT_1792915 [Gymnopilus junonius]
MSEEQAYQQVVGHADMVLIWLQRSGVCPLYISVFGKDNYNWYGRRGAIPVVLFDTYAEAILPFTKRWKSLSLTGIYSSFSSIASISNDDVPSLESLFLNLRREEHILPDVLLTLWTNSGLFRSPSLRQLCMRDLILDMTQLQVQWKGLTHLRLGSAFDDHHDHWSYGSLLASLSRVLKYCTSLICCQLYLPYLEEYDPADAISSMYLPSIKHLTFHETSDSLPFVEKLEIPNAKELDFRSSLEGAGETIVALLARTNGNLRKFAMQTEHVSDAHFIECLLQCPNLTVLSLKHIRDRPLPEFHIDDKLLNLLISQDDTILCPLLEEFKCDFTTDFTFEGFVDFVKEKQSTLNGRVAKLKRVHIHAVMEFDPSTERQEYKLMRPEFQGYIDDGMLFEEHRYGYENASEPSESFTPTAGLTSEQYTMWDIQI